MISARLAAALLLATPVLGTAERAPLLLDDFSRPDGRSALGTAWRAFTDQVMGGVSTQSVGRETVEGERALRLRGEVRLDNNGGFVQVALPSARGPRHCGQSSAPAATPSDARARAIRGRPFILTPRPGTDAFHCTC